MRLCEILLYKVTQSHSLVLTVFQTWKTDCNAFSFQSLSSDKSRPADLSNSTDHVLLNFSCIQVHPPDYSTFTISPSFSFYLSSSETFQLSIKHKFLAGYCTWAKLSPFFDFVEFYCKNYIYFPFSKNDINCINKRPACSRDRKCLLLPFRVAS